jgi:hypothetical protein
MEPYTRNGSIIGKTMDFGSTEAYGEEAGGSITFVGGTGIGVEDSSNNLTLPTGLQPGDLVIVTSGSDNNVTQLTPTGYTSMGSFNYAVDGWWSYKFMGDPVDTAISGLTFDGQTTHLAVVFRGVDQSTPFDAAYVRMPNNDEIGTPDPSPITTVTDGAMVVALGYLDDDKVASGVTAPTGYTLAATSQSVVAGVTVMAAYKVLATAGTEDPGAFGGGSDNIGAFTIALRPAVSGGGGSTNKKNSGIWDLQAVYETKASQPPSVNLPAGTLVYSSLADPAGSTTASGYYWDGSTFVEQTNLFSVRSGASTNTEMSTGASTMTGKTTSALSPTFSNSNVDGWELSSQATAAMAVGTSPLSVQFWWNNRQVSAGQQWGRIFSWGEYLDNGSGWSLEQYSTSTTQFSVYETIGPASGDRRQLLNRQTFGGGWYHIYWACDPGSNLSLFAINGSIVYSSSAQYITSFSVTDFPLSLGMHGSVAAAERGYGGYYQEFIVRNDIPYTSNFTPSTTPLL